MAIKRITPTRQIMQYMDDNLIKPAERKGIRALQYGGEVGLTQAREHGSYQDQTGNLRSSTGYKIAHNGSLLSGSTFDQIKEGSEGSREGSSFAEEMAIKLSRGNKSALVQVAGMPYAAELEARGYDVLTSAEMLAEREVPKLLSKLGLEKR